jgi:hypothetical protein
MGSARLVTGAEQIYGGHTALLIGTEKINADGISRSRRGWEGTPSNTRDTRQNDYFMTFRDIRSS